MIRNLYTGQAAGDLIALDNPSSLEALAALRSRQRSGRETKAAEPDPTPGEDWDGLP